MLYYIINYKYLFAFIESLMSMKLVAEFAEDIRIKA